MCYLFINTKSSILYARGVYIPIPTIYRVSRIVIHKTASLHLYNPIRDIIKPLAENRSIRVRKPELGIVRCYIKIVYRYRLLNAFITFAAVR